MSYQVLARKWRPQNFKQMVGQEHVLQALIHALESQRLHHAYLFTGTRGVGKTTIGRILAKCLSCDVGITAEPCGQCSACVGIAEGRYVDLIEIDAASRTKVEDMRELLDNVQYAPSEGRFKIYLIDEVHMLSQSSFNALLKTLEEPPEHVKFLFATTDPQKLPVTILSRCLQFNLKNMSPERIVRHLQQVLSAEEVGFEEPALWALARAADGSMRDALSLTDQAIAYGNHQLSEAGVSAMLGTVDQKRIYRILDALVKHDASAVLEEVNALAEFSPDYGSVLASLVAILHRVSVEQAVPGATDNAMGDQQQVIKLANQLCAEDLQLFYQIALVSRKDLAITPDPKAGLEMALLRMLAFKLQVPEKGEIEDLPESSAPSEQTSESTQSLPQPAVSAAPIPAENIEPRQEPAGSAGLNEAHAENANQKNEPEVTLAEAETQHDTPPVSSGVKADGGEGESMSLSHAALVEPPEGFAPPIEAYGDVPHEPVDDLGPAGWLDVSPPAENSLAESKKKTPLNGPEAEARAIPPASGAHEEGKSQAAVAEQLGGEQRSGGDVSGTDSVNTAAKSNTDFWPLLAGSLGVTGMTQNLLLNMVLEQQPELCELYVDAGHFRLLNDSHERRIEAAVKSHFGQDITLRFKEGLQPGHETPMMWRERRKAEMLVEAKQTIQRDPNVVQLIEAFDAAIIEDSIRPLGELG